MSKATKVIVSLLIIVLILLAGVIYFRSAVVEEDSSTEPIVSSAKTGDVDLDSLLSSLDQEQSEETQLLSSSEAEVSALADESSLLDGINQTYQNEL
jgi:hypothetical protein